MNNLVARYRENKDFELFLKVLFILLMSRLCMLLLMAAYNLFMGTDRSIASMMNPWDGLRYAFIIDHGYTFPLDTDPQANWAFFPMYVIGCWLVKALTLGLIDAYWTGMLVSNVCILIAAFYAVKYMRTLSDAHESCILIALLMLAGPYTFYCSAVYTEAMFIMFIVLFFWFCRKKCYLLAGLMSAFASATRIVGCILVFALLTELYMDMVPGRIRFSGIWSFIVKMLAAPKRMLAVLLCPLGTFCYMAFLRFFCGDVWAYKNVQIAWREDEYFPVFGVLWKACTGQIEPRYTYMGWFCIAAFIVYGYMLYQKHYAMAVFGIISLLVPLTSHVMSTCRFTIGTYVIFVGIYDLLKWCEAHYKWLKWMILVLFAAAEGVLLMLWYNSDCWLM